MDILLDLGIKDDLMDQEELNEDYEEDNACDAEDFVDVISNCNPDWVNYPC